MIETTTRRDRRPRIRLDHLTGRTDPEQRPWLDVAPDESPLLLEPRPWPPDQPATGRPPDPDRRATDLPTDSPPHGRPSTSDPRPDGDPRTAATPDAARSTVGRPTTDPPAGAPLDGPPGSALPIGWPAAEPWWRRTARRLAERWLPERTTDPPRWRLAVLAAGGVLLGVAVAVGFTLSGTREQPEVPPALPAASVSEVRQPSGGATPGTGDSIVISVVGRVTTPGLVTLPDGARVADALKASGGPVPGVDLGGLNLARRLTDGEQIYVGVPTPPGAEAPAAAAGPGQPGTARVDLNSASLAALDTLPGVGPVTAQRIVDWRTQHGRFASVDQLREVDGIGPSRFAKLKDLVVAG